MIGKHEGGDVKQGAQEINQEHPVAVS